MHGVRTASWSKGESAAASGAVDSVRAAGEATTSAGRPRCERIRGVQLAILVEVNRSGRRSVGGEVGNADNPELSAALGVVAVKGVLRARCPEGEGTRKRCRDGALLAH